MTAIANLTAQQIHDVRRRRLAAFVTLQDFGRVRLRRVGVDSMLRGWINVTHYEGEQTGEAVRYARVPADCEVEIG